MTEVQIKLLVMLMALQVLCVCIGYIIGTRIERQENLELLERARQYMERTEALLNSTEEGRNALRYAQYMRRMHEEDDDE